MMFLFGFLLMAVWSGISDYWRVHRLVLALLAIITAGSFEMLLFWQNATRIGTMWYLTIVFVIFGSVTGGLLPLTDYQMLQLLTHKYGLPKTLYGRQRMMGSISYGLTNFLTGLLMDLYGPTVLFYLFPIMASIFVILLFFFGYSSADDSGKNVTTVVSVTDEKKSAESPSAAQAITSSTATTSTTTGSAWEFVFFIFTVFIIGSGRQLLQIYLPMFLEEKMGMSGTEAGFSVVCSMILSIPFLFMGAKLIGFFGEFLMLLLSLLAMTVRLGAYALLPQKHSYAYFAYAIELLNSVGFSFTILAGVKIAADCAPKGLEATAQTIYMAFYMQLPAVIVSYAGGHLYKGIGPSAMFSRCAQIFAVFSVIYALKLVITRKIRS
jgi:PPP family 3-phenylpropionic acid transporter